MKLYKNSNGVWAGTQAKARSFCGKDYSTVDVPVDKAGLLQFLNVNQVGSYVADDSTDIVKLKLQQPPEMEDNIAWFRWAYDCMCRGQYDDAKEMLRKGLIDDVDTSMDATRDQSGS